VTPRISIESLISKPRIHEIAFGGRAPPGPAGELTALPRPPSRIKGGGGAGDRNERERERKTNHIGSKKGKERNLGRNKKWGMCMSLIVTIHYWQPYRLAPLKMSWPSLALPLQKSWRRHWFWARANFSGETSVPLAYWKKSHHGIIYHSTTGGRGVHPLKLFDTSPTPPQLEVLIVLTPLCMLCTAGGYYMTKLGYYSSLYCIKNFSF